jgi:hypothetical protein
MNHGGRYELKFILDEDRAVAVADFVQAYMEPSKYNPRGPVRGHAICNLYLDSPDFLLFRQANTGQTNRFKLRFRIYDDQWHSPAYMEIKHRLNDVICKDRTMVTRASVEKYLTEGWNDPLRWPDCRELGPDAARLDVCNMFWQLASRTRACGVAVISYLREIYDAPGDGEMRVTFDRQVHATPYDGSGRLTLPRWGIPMPKNQAPYHVPHNGVIMELKFSTQAPRWMFAMVRYFNLRRVAMSKYCACLGGMGLPWGKTPLWEQQVPLQLHLSL